MAGKRSIRCAVKYALAAVAVTFAVALAPSLMAPYVSAVLSERAGVQLQIAWISWNPFAGRVTFHGVSVAPETESTPIVICDAIEINVALRRWIAGETVLDRLRVARPRIDLRRTADGDFNLTSLFRFAPPEPQVTTPAVPTDPAATALDQPTVAVRSLRIEGGSVDFRDETTEPVLETSLHFEDMSTTDLVFSAGGWADVSLHVESEMEREPLTLALTYRATPDDSNLEATLTMANVSLARSLLYFPLGWQQVSGTLDLRLSYRHHSVGGTLRAHQMKAQALGRDLAFAESWAEEQTAHMSRASLDAITVDFMRRETNLGKIDVADYRLLLLRDNEGIRIPLVAPRSTAPASGWRTVFDRVDFGKGTAVLRDVADGGNPELRADVLSGAIRAKGDVLSFAANLAVAEGEVAIEGASTQELTTVSFALDDLSLAELTARLRAPVTFGSGRVDGKVVVRLSGDSPRVSASLAIAGAKSLPPDPAHPEEVLAWHDLALEVADVAFDPLRVHVTEARFAWPYLMIHRRSDGTYPLTYAERPAGAAAARSAVTSAEPPADPHVLVIDHGTVRGGRVEFYDTSLDPPYWTGLAEIEASFAGLRVSPFTLDDFHLNGALDELSPASAKGSVDTDALRASVSLERLRLAPLSPYIEPALGHEITSGVARVESRITVTASELDVTSDLVLSRFAMTGAGNDFLRRRLGAPLTLALALMKDRRGDIRLRLPLHGDLKAQEYHVGSVVLSALKEALAGAVRTPLRLLGSVFRTDEGESFDLRPVPFPAASAEIGAEGDARVAQVARVLERHGALRVVLLPDPSQADEQRMRDDAIVRRVDGIPVGERTDAEQAILQFLRMRQTDTSPHPLAPEVAENLRAIETATVIATERLQELAEARAAAVTRRLVERHKLAENRILQLPWKPAALQPGTLPGVDIQLRGD